MFPFPLAAFSSLLLHLSITPFIITFLHVLNLLKLIIFMKTFSKLNHFNLPNGFATLLILWSFQEQRTKMRKIVYPFRKIRKNYFSFFFLLFFEQRTKIRKFVYPFRKIRKNDLFRYFSFKKKKKKRFEYL